MSKVYKLVFENQEEWEQLRLELYKDGKPLFDMAQPVVLGTLYEQPAWDPETEEKPEKVALEGFHVDIKAYEEISCLDSFDREVHNPQHNFS